MTFKKDEVVIVQTHWTGGPTYSLNMVRQVQENNRIQLWLPFSYGGDMAVLNETGQYEAADVLCGLRYTVWPLSGGGRAQGFVRKFKLKLHSIYDIG